MAHLQVDIEAEYLNIRQRQNGEQLQIPIAEEAYRFLVKAKVWKDELEAGLAPEAINDWFSKQLGQPCRLVRMKSESERHTEPDYVGTGQAVSLADGYPILLASEASLDHLNQQLEQDISMLRFRPNLVVSGGSPFQEDHWDHFQIGTAHFKGVKSCSRCQVITIDPETAEIGKEPLRTLATYRTFNRKVKFGENICWEANSGDLVQVGDTVTVHSNKQVQYHQSTQN